MLTSENRWENWINFSCAMDSSNPSTLLVNKDNTKDVLVDKNNATKEYVTFTGKSHEHGESTKTTSRTQTTISL